MQHNQLIEDIQIFTYSAEHRSAKSVLRDLLEILYILFSVETKYSTVLVVVFVR